MEIEGEINNFIMVWTLAVASLCYCYKIGEVVPIGKARLLALLPAIVLLLLLPLRLTSINLGGPTSFFLGWLSTFKILLFAFGKGPLSSNNPPLPLSHFVPLTFLPIKFQNQPIKDKLLKTQNEDNAYPQTPKKYYTLNYTYTIMVILLASCFPIYQKKESFHPKFILFLNSLHMYISMELIFALFAELAREFLRVQLEPQFDKPYLCTSLQDFWGRRWNIMVTRILHPTVYDPVLSASGRVIGRKWAPLPAIVATFTVSGLMHELIFYYIKREKRTWEAWEPSWDSMCFFLLHGVCLAVEVAAKKALKGKWRLPTAVSRLLTVAFVMSTALWLFVPALVRTGAYLKGSRECIVFIELMKNVLAS